MFENKFLSPITRYNNLLFRNTKKSKIQPKMKPTVTAAEKKRMTETPLSECLLAGS